MSLNDSKPRDPEKVIVELKSDETEQSEEDALMAIASTQEADELSAPHTSQSVQNPNSTLQQNNETEPITTENTLSSSLDYLRQSTEIEPRLANTATVTTTDSTLITQLDEGEIYRRIWTMKFIVKHTDFVDYSLFVGHDCARSFQKLLAYSLGELQSVDFDQVEIEYECKQQHEKECSDPEQAIEQ